MGEEELLNQAERASAEARMESLAKESRHPWLQEPLTLCALAAAIAVVVVFSALR